MVFPLSLFGTRIGSVEQDAVQLLKIGIMEENPKNQTEENQTSPKEPTPKSKLEILQDQAEKKALKKYEERTSLEDHRDLLKNRAYTP